MTISPIIVTYNNESTIGKVLSALTAQDLPVGVTLASVVVDKGSSDDTLKRVRENGSATVVELPHPNTGPGIGFNEGADHVDGDILLLLTGDMVLQERHVVSRAVDLVEEDAKCVYGGRILTYEGGVQHSRGSWPTLSALLAYRFRCCERSAMHRWDGYDRTEAVDWVCGGFSFFSRETWDRVGGYDTDYFLYFEDIDYCRRVYASGGSVRYVPEVSALHDHPAPDRRTRKTHWVESYNLFCRKHLPAYSPTRIIAALWRLAA